ncbi:MAG: hypothetical protein HQK49_16665 [Oligoflexia bacterium]|nr:hypothetical protein [Oligoflexia bacterium]
MKDLLYLNETYDDVDVDVYEENRINEDEKRMHTLRDLANRKSTIIKYKTDKYYLSIDMGPEQVIDLKGLLSEIEEYIIDEMLKMSKGNKNKASKYLKINRTTLIEKMKKINMRKIITQ